MFDPHSASADRSWVGLQKALPDFLIAGMFLLVWIKPDALRSIAFWLPGVELVGVFVLLMFAEFIFVCAFGPISMLAHSRKPTMVKLVGLGFIGLCVMPFLVMLCRGAKAIWPIVEVVILGANKWLSGRQSKGADHKLGLFHIIFRWSAMGGLYIAVMFLAILVPIPALGAESWMVRESGIPMSGEMVNRPQMMLAAGTIYFGLLGVYELLFERMTRRR